MKFSAYLSHHVVTEWKDNYIDYDFFYSLLLASFSKYRGNQPAHVVIEVPLTAAEVLHAAPRRASYGPETPEKATAEGGGKEAEKRREEGGREGGRGGEDKEEAEKRRTEVEKQMAAAEENYPDKNDPQVTDLEAQVQGRVIEPIADTFSMAEIIPTIPMVELNDIIELAKRRASLAGTFQSEFDYDVIPEGSREFFKRLNADVKRGVDFFLDRQFDFEKLFGELAERVNAMEELTDDLMQDRTKRLLMHEFRELYRQIVLLKSFATLNITSLSNICYAYDRFCKTHYHEVLMKGVHDNNMFSEIPLEELIQKVEDLYIQLDHVHHGKAPDKDYLHQLLPDIPKTFHDVAFRNGWYLGLILPALVIMIYLAANDPARLQDVSFVRITRVYAGYAVLMIYLWALGFNQAIWKQYRINYVYILELDPSNHIQIPHYFELISGMSVLVTYSYLLYMWNINVGEFHPEYHPLLLSGVLLLVLVFPLNVYYRSTRYWMIAGLFRLLAAPFIKVKFRDFMAADQFCSLVYILVSVQYMFCIYFPNNDSPFLCNQRTGWLTLLIAIFPSLVRFFQCIRRFYDLRSRAHLVNALKYVSAILVSVFALLTRVYDDSVALFAVWIVVAILSSVYSFVWDTLRDWGLFERGAKHKYLRGSMAYPSPWLYYVCMPLNLGLRIAWVVTLSENPASPTLRDFILAAFEVYRRFQWNVFRVEFEHVSNAEKFRSCRHVPVAYHVDASPRHYRSILCQ